MSAASELEKIAHEVAVCTKCDLCKHRTNTVPGEGSPHARVMFIGEAPGFHEDQQGRPFVGQSGQLLNKLLEAVKLPREEVFIANVVKCHPPQNLDPTPGQMAACQPYLDRQIAAINPRLVVTLGRFSMARYWPGQYISQIHGQVKQADGRLYLPMFHPSAALRDRDRTLPKFKADGLQIPALLAKAEEISRNEIWGYPLKDAPDPVVAPPDSPAVAQDANTPVVKIVKPTVAPPLTVAETPAAFETKPQPEPLKGEADKPGPFVAPVVGTLKAEEPTSKEVETAKGVERGNAVQPGKLPPQEVKPAPAQVASRVKNIRAEVAPGVEPAQTRETLPANGPKDIEDLAELAAQAQVVPGLSLAEVGQTGRGRKQPGEPAKPRKKRPPAPGEQLSMF